MTTRGRLANDEVTGIRGGRVPEVMYIEGCA
jgi:hypothetical protein